MILAPDDLRDAHVDVVANDAEVVKRATVRPQQREVLDVGVLALLHPVHAVLEARGATVGDLEANRERLALGTPRRFLGRQDPTFLVAAPRLACRLPRRAPGLQP